jgi:hypothetical protein
MTFADAAPRSTDTIIHFTGGEQARRLDDFALGVDPLWFDRIEPGALGSGSSLRTDCSISRNGWSFGAHACTAGGAVLLHQVSSSKPNAQAG